MQLGPASCSPLAVGTQRARHPPDLRMRDLLSEVPRHAQRSSLLADEQRQRTRHLQMPSLRECQRVAFRHRSRGGADLVVSFFGEQKDRRREPIARLVLKFCRAFGASSVRPQWSSNLHIDIYGSNSTIGLPRPNIPRKRDPHQRPVLPAEIRLEHSQDDGQ